MNSDLPPAQCNGIGVPRSHSKHFRFLAMAYQNRLIINQAIITVRYILFITFWVSFGPLFVVVVGSDLEFNFHCFVH